MSHNGDDSIKTARCPLCSGAPVLAAPMITPWFCSNHDCEALAWDPYSTLAENLMNAAPVEVIHNQDNSDEMPNQ
jgi:hypothetical protein